MQTGIRLESGMLQENFSALVEGIHKLATASPFEEVNLSALNALSTIAKIDNVTIQSCNVTSNDQHFYVDTFEKEED